MINLNILALIFVFIQSTPIYSQELYKFEDLKILAKENSYLEFMKHMSDIRPTNRDKKWKELSLDVTGKYLDILKKSQVHLPEVNKVVLKKINNSFLKNDSIIALKMSELIQSQLRACQDQKLGCSYLADHYLLVAGKFSDIDYAVYREFKGQYTSIDKLFFSFIKSKDADLYCKRDLIASKLVEYLQQNYKYSSKNEIKAISANISKNCFKALTPHIKDLIVKEKSDDKKIEFFILVLTTHNLITEKETDLLLTYYLLGHPVKGDILNLAWGRMETLSQDFKRRQNTLKELLRLDPLPDRVFLLPNKSKRDIIINHLHKNFPEYIDSYARTCVHFYEGAKEFPSGNPTIYCDRLFELTKNSKRIISDSLRIRHSSAKKIQ